ncbi:eCIS core domain-containing protein [Streptomyces sp. NPDC001393]
MRAHDKENEQSDTRSAPRRPAGPAPAGLEALQRAVGNEAVTRAVARERDGQVQRRSLVHDVLRSPGRPMDARLREEMEARFGGADFSGVRVHSDEVARRSAVEIQAKAYTSGAHVVDGGRMTKEDWAHELTHYLDQQAGPVPGTDNGSGLRVSDPADAGERRAVANARRVMSGGAPVQRTAEEHTSGHPTGSRRTHAASPVQRNEDDDLRNAKTPDEILAALKKSGHSDDDAWQLMQYMTSQQFRPGEGQSEFNILDSIKQASQQRIAAVRRRQAGELLAKRWTIRHYTGRDPENPPSFTEIASTYENAAAGRASEHTNVADWRSLGNIKFTFYLVAVDGQVPQRNWLNNTHWYAEWDLDEIADCWISPDLLEKMNKSMDADAARETMKTAKAFRGTGAQLKELLAVSAFGSGNDPAAALDTAIGGAFELKVPGGLTVKEWKKK